MPLNCSTLIPSIKKVVTLITILVAISVTAQPPELKQQKLFGFFGSEQAHRLLKIPSNSTRYYFGCTTSTNSADMGTNHGQGDFWISMIDDTAKLYWKLMLGGSSEELLGNMVTTPDGGVILVGSTRSTDGDVSGNHNNNNSSDGWIVKLSATGTIEWQKCYGGTSNDQFLDVITSQGGYIVSGSTASTDGDLAGINSSLTHQVWIMNINSNGTIIWQKTYGGTGYDEGKIIRQRTDGGYVVGAITGSNNGNVSGNHGLNDIWLLKLSSTGTLQSSRCYGGSWDERVVDIEVLPNGNYLVAGSTLSSNADVTGYHGNGDAWIFAVNNSNLLMQWGKCVGGSQVDEPGEITPSADGSFLIIGSSESNNGDVTGNHGSVDAWILNMSTTGVLNWQTCIGTTEADLGMTILEKSNNELLIAGKKDVFGPTVWIFTAGSINRIKGSVFADVNYNGTKDPAEQLLNEVILTTEKSNGFNKVTQPLNGVFEIIVDTGTYTTKALPIRNYYTISPLVHNSVFSSFFNTDSFGFAAQPIPGIQDLSVNVFAITPARPGFKCTYKIIYKNVGTMPVSSGSIIFTNDSRLSFFGASPTHSTITGNNVTWNFSNLQPFDTREITVEYTTASPPALNINDTLTSSVVINPLVGDQTPSDNSANVRQVVIGSYDPNDKREVHGGRFTTSQLSSGEKLLYIIRFQNTGTDTAFNITVKDTLSDKLDLTSIEMVEASHDYNFSVNGNKLTWQFNNIILPDINANEPASNGFIAFRVKPKSTLVAGDVILNTASIYFDYNLPIRTNTEQTVIQLPAALPVTILRFTANKVNNTNELKWSTVNEVNTSHFIIQRSNNGRDFEDMGRVNAMGNAFDYFFLDVSPFSSRNFYRLQMVDNDGIWKYSQVVAVDNSKVFVATVSPNPTSDKLIVLVTSTHRRALEYNIANNKGQRLVKGRLTLNPGANSVPLDITIIPAGTYFLQLNSGEEMTSIRFIKL